MSARTLQPALTVCAAALIGMAVAANAAAPVGTMFIGKLHDASAVEVVVHVGTELATFTMTTQTSVTLDGKPAQVTDLQPGDQVSVTAGPGDGRFRSALDVAARRHVIRDSPPEKDVRNAYNRRPPTAGADSTLLK